MNTKVKFMDYSVPVKVSPVFGICDLSENENHIPAFIDYEDKSIWGATVISGNKDDFKFIPVDNNVPVYDAKGNTKSRCDGVLYTTKTVCFVELKKERKEWLSGALSQLESTIEDFEDTGEINSFKFKRAYVCNTKHPNFSRSFAGTQKRFHDETGIVLRITTQIENIK